MAGKKIKSGRGGIQVESQEALQETRRERILAVARQIVAEQGGDALNMKELAKVAEVPRATLYRYYRSKEHVISDVALAWGNSLVDRLKEEKNCEATVSAQITGVFASILREAEQHPNLIAVTLSSLMSSDVDAKSLQHALENLLPALLGEAIDFDKIPEAEQVISAILTLLLSNLILLSATRISLVDALNNMEFTARKLIGDSYWNSPL